MPIISKIRKGSPTLKAQVLFVYLVLIAGAITMIYPFLMMVSGSFKSEVDSKDYDIVPRYFHDDSELFRKYMEARYDENVLFVNSITGAGIASFAEIQPPKRINRVMVQEWKEFLGRTKMPQSFYQLGQSSSLQNKFMPLMQRKFANYANREFKGDIAEYNRTFNDMATAWFHVGIPTERLFEKSFTSTDTEAQRFFRKFKSGQPRFHRVYLSAANMYRYSYLALQYGDSIDSYNKTHGTKYRSYNDVVLTQTVPVSGLNRLDWMKFVRENLNRVFVESTPSAIDDYHRILKSKYENDITRLNRLYAKDYRSFDEVEFPKNRSVAGASLVDYDLFVQETKPEHLRIVAPDMLFRSHLREKYGSIDKLNEKAGTSFASFTVVNAPVFESDWAGMQANRKAVKTEFITRNYKIVLSYLLLQGRGIRNTVIFCLLAIILALTVNPVAAYGLSRYNLPSTYKVLLFMMATMAFPSVVTMIPNFLLLKQLNLLNTFWALVLPTAANGYMIFLLKGFFDSLPRELYEAGMIDGASEWTMFWRITMSLSKPILAVMTLNAFTAAYGAFMFAFLVCQDQSMWTLMVWLFRLQQDAHMAVTYAALIIAAIPPLIVFIFSQNVIMRGIIIPQEK